MNKIINKATLAISAILTIVLSVSLFIGSKYHNTTYALSSGDEACESLKALDPTTDCANSDVSKKEVSDLTQKITRFITYIGGIAAIIMIIIGGLKLVTSSGGEKGVKQGKAIITMAVAGLIVLILANIIIKFVFNQAKSITETTPSHKNSYLKSTV
jgi:TRAP-type C4-dicarboxylate transport system permease small subunit